MKVEIKKIGVLNVILSVFPVAVFVVMFIGGIVNLSSPEISVNVTVFMQMIMQAILNTLLFMVFTVVFLFAYNFLSSLGIRAVCVELEDKE